MKWAWQVPLLGVLYVIAGRLGLELTRYHDTVTLVVWPPTGLGLAALILCGRRLWPGVFLGALGVNASLPVDGITATGMSVASTLEALLAATLLLRVADFRPTLERPRDGLAFILIGVVGCTAVGAMLGSLSVLLLGNMLGDFWSVWLIWWLSHMGGAMILAPALLMLMRGTPPWSSLVRSFEGWFVFTILIVSSLVAFFGPDLGLLGFAAAAVPFPVLVWGGFRLGPRGATMASLIVVLIATIALAQGSGPFAMGAPTEGTVLLWMYSMFLGMTAFAMATVVEQGNLAERRYRSQEVDRMRIERQKLLFVERERLTREMHDGLGGQLVSVLAMVERGLAAPSEVAEGLRRAIDDLRIVIDSLDPTTTDLATSLAKLRARLEPLLRRNGIELKWSIDDAPSLYTFPPEASLHVLRIIQEAVTNTLRHANADSVEVKISCCDDERRRLHIRIRDDGRGLPQHMGAGGRGIRNMKSRAEELAAELSIEGSNLGTRIELAIPFPR